jgi:recombination associated protein RdgC
VEAALDKARYVECGASQEKAAGWVEPRGEPMGRCSSRGRAVDPEVHDRGQVGAGLGAQPQGQGACPADRADHGRKPGKKETKEIKEEIKHSLLPMAFSKQGAVLVWIDLQRAC